MSINLLDVGSLINNVGKTAVDLRKAITGKMSADQEYQLQVMILQMENDSLKAQNQLLTAQAEINKVEASNPNLYISGWRPTVGWGSTAGFLLQILIFPIAKVVLNLCGIDSAKMIPELDMATIMSVLGSLLGIGAIGVMRSYEKKNGIQNLH
jgi:uncharacterized membrane protein YjfL (UPF0719 family)